MQNDQIIRQKRERNALVTGILMTVILHVGALVLVSFTGLKYIYPPPQEQSMLIDFTEVEDELVDLLQSEEDPTFSIFSDESVPIGEIVQVMNIAKRNHYKVILATQPE